MCKFQPARRCQGLNLSSEKKTQTHQRVGTTGHRAEAGGQNQEENANGVGEGGDREKETGMEGGCKGCVCTFSPCSEALIPPVTTLPRDEGGPYLTAPKQSGS